MTILELLILPTYFHLIFQHFCFLYLLGLYIFRKKHLPKVCVCVSVYLCISVSAYCVVYIDIFYIGLLIHGGKNKYSYILKWKKIFKNCLMSI